MSNVQLSTEQFMQEMQGLCARYSGADIPALTQPLKPSESGDFVATCLKADQPFMMHGDPGVGKSQVAMQQADLAFAHAYGCTVQSNFDVTDANGRVLRDHERPWFYDFRTALHDAVDLTGVPFVDSSSGSVTTRFAPPSLLTDLDPRGGLFFFDEINRGSDMTRNAALSLVLTRTVGKIAMPTTWTVGAAVNDKDTGISKMSAALTRRFTHFTMTTDLNDVCKYAIRRGWEPVVIAYLRMFPQLLNCFDAKEKISPNARAWEFVSKIVAANTANSRVQHALIAGNVGDAAAIQFSAFLRLYTNLPAIDAVLLNPKKAIVPTDAGSIYAIAAALSRRANAQNFSNIMIYLNRLPAEYNVFSVQCALVRDPSLQHTGEYTRWAVEHQDVTF